MRNPYQTRGNKYGRRKVERDGITFDSMLECQVYLLLKADKRIKALETQVKVYLTKAKILAKIDFKVEYLDGSIIYVEAKGKDLPTWNIKKRLWKHYGPGQLNVMKGSYKNPKLDQIITPEVANATMGNEKNRG